VAIKLVDRSMLSHRSAELFRHERQTLASLEHPNIARLLDAGTTEGGITA
jgi:eukaryotic-like serine/threonine-protein kinase